MPAPIPPIVRNANLAIAGVFLTLELILAIVAMPFNFMADVFMLLSKVPFALGRKIMSENRAELPTEEDPTCEKP